MINLIWVALFVLIVGLGVLQAYFRDLGKARIRGISVVSCAILAVVLTILTKDLWMSESTLDGILAGFGDTKMFVELMEVSPSLCEVILQCIASLIAPILCLVYFVLLAFLTWIAYLIVTMILSQKLKDHNEDAKHNKIRACIWGGVQGFVIFLILMVPVSSYVEIAAPIVDNVTKADILDDETEKNLQAIMDGYIAPVNNGTALVYRYMGGKLIVDSMTDFSVKDIDVDFSEEIGAVASLACNVVELANTEFTNYGPAEGAAVAAVADSFEESVLLPTITGELIYSATDSWLNGRTFLGIEKPSAGEMGAIFDPFLEALLEILHDDAKASQTLQADIRTVAAIVNIFAEHRVFENLSDVDQLMTTLSSNGIVGKLVTTLGENQSMKRLIPEITNLGVRAIATTLGVPADVHQVYGELLDDITKSVNYVKILPEDQRIDYLTENLGIAFDNAGVPIDEELLDCFSVSMIKDLVESDKAQISSNDIQAFFEVYAMNSESSLPQTTDSSEGLSATIPLNKNDRFAGTAYAGKSEDELKQTGAAVLAVVYSQLTMIDSEGNENFSVEAIAIISASYGNILNSDSTTMKKLESINLKKAPTAEGFKVTVALKQSDTMITQKVMMSDLLIDSKVAAGNINADTLDGEVETVTKIFDAANSLSKQLSYGNNIGVEEIAGSVGEILDALDSSNSYGGEKTASLFTAVLQSETVRETANIDMKTATQMAQKATEGNPNYTQTMNVVSTTVTVMNKFSKEDEEITEEELIELIRSINPQSAGMLEVFATPERLQSYNVPEKYSGISSELIATVFHHMASAEFTDAEYQQEAKALNQMLNIALSARTSSGAKYLFAKEGQVSVLPYSAEEMVALFMSSQSIGATLRDTMLVNGVLREDRYDAFDLAAKMPTDSTDCQDGIAAFEAYYQANASEQNRQTINALAALLGISNNLLG